MIVYTHDLNLANEIARKMKNDRPYVMNLSSSYYGFTDITPLITKFMQYMSDKPNIIINSVQFDMEYAMAIEKDPMMYTSYMKMIVNSYEGELVIVLVARDEYRDSIMESLIKYTQEKYGHKSWIVESLEDIELIKEDRFSPAGLEMIDSELNRESMYVSGMMDKILDPVCVE